MKKTHLLLLAGAVLLAGGTASAQQTPSGSADSGKKLYETLGCYQCHNRAAQGAGATGPRLAPGPIPYQNFIQQVRHPRYEMPPYEIAIVTDQQVADIYAFLQTIPKPPDPKTIPLLN
jgi:mono/diheme cytochrome c family protein